MDPNANWPEGMYYDENAGAPSGSYEQTEQSFDDQVDGETELFSPLSDESDESDNEEDNPHIEPQLHAQKKKRNQKKNEKNRIVKQQTKKVLEVATTSQLPSHTSTESRSIVEFVKFMMGCPSRNFELPPAPTPQEVETWTHWADNRQEQITNHLDRYIERKNPKNATERKFLVTQELQRIKQMALPTKYSPARTVRNSNISVTVKNTCDHEFKSNGFPRITFDWSDPDLENSDWNSATASILASNWAKWTPKTRALTKDSNINVTGVIGRWLVTMKKETKRKALRKNGANITDPSVEQMNAKRKQSRKKVGELRFKTASTLFPDHPEIWACFTDVNGVSDYECDEDIRIPPRRINPAWRSAVFAELTHEIDVATIQLAPQRSKTSIAGRLARRGPREATNEEAEAEVVPMNYPVDAYAAEFLGQLSLLQRQQMGIQDDELAYSFTTALTDLRKKTRSSNSMIE
ncbi:uncharacterized protein PGTG_18943 [Puccinia graminis f. sp. tritici CRL 75-36-700-3]|uniref:Uncharacterized protein n=1 Tax=Puccinia graminis f. sp. tritici (strain CRL 75-36-700-3 / race SCCL) TaxID=418459 RepID=E3LAF4_PUCGT|nr:uncharacterized protein PGTG_18943 [Puccinia graminis f. sp. tritici CRL 75-36-700-3]EFP93529.2 hypothetical protein PGTG_18943 [Puccinia graminis f. sp. tritici CRL 75-36-700-3]